MSSESNAFKEADSHRSWVRWAVVASGTILSAMGTIEALLKQFSKALESLGESFKGLKSVTEAFGFTGPASWAAVAALLIFGFLLIWFGSIKRSKLRRPEALVLHTGDVNCLRGREGDLANLVRLCRDRSLVFLVGKSGTGKSAIVRAGLCQPETLPRTIVPVLVDVWGEDWSEGPTRRLAEAVRNSRLLTEEERVKLQLAPGAKLPGLLAAIKRFRAKLGRTPLLIFDQFDDYQVRQRALFLDSTTGAWKSAAQIEAENPFWQGIAELVRAGDAHVLIVTWTEMASGLSSVSFAPDPPYYPLDPPSADVVRPLLDHLTRDDQPGGPVVSDPRDGWEELKDRLAEDLESNNGQVLPIQLQTALAGLSSLPSLTVTAYRRAGGLQGLENRAVWNMIASAADYAGLKKEQVILLLKALVYERPQDHFTNGHRTTKDQRGDGRATQEGTGALTQNAGVGQGHDEQ